MSGTEIGQNLIRSSELLLAGHANPRLLDAVLSEFGRPSRAFIIDWIPEQGEDIYTVVIPPTTVAIIEIPRDEESTEKALIQRIPLHQYVKDAKGATKELKRKLSIVQKLLK